MATKISDIITKQMLRERAGDTIYNRGRHYFLAERVQFVTLTNERVIANVFGTHLYRVEIRLTDNNALTYHCDCPYDDFCKHIVAVGLGVEAKATKASEATKPVACRASSDSAAILPMIKKKRARVKRLAEWEEYVQSIVPERAEQANQWLPHFTLRIENEGWMFSAQKIYLKKDGSSGRLASIQIADLDGDGLLLNRSERFALAYIFAMEDNLDFRYRLVRYVSDSTIFKAMGDNCGYLFELLRDSQLFLEEGRGHQTALRFSPEKGRISFRSEFAGKDISCRPYLVWAGIEAPIDPELHLLTSGPIWILRENTLIEIDGFHDAKSLLPFTIKNFSLTVPRRSFAEFLRRIEDNANIARNLELPPELSVEEITTPVVPRLYLDEQHGLLDIHLRFAYGDHEFEGVANADYGYVSTETNGRNILRVRRDPVREQEYLDLLADTGVLDVGDFHFQPRTEETLEWLLLECEVLVNQGFEIFGEQNLDKLKVRRGSPRIEVTVKSEIDWFDLKLVVDFDGLLVSVAQLQKALQQKKPYVKLSDGSTARIPEEWLRRFEHLMQLGEAQKDNLRVSRLHATMIDIMAEEVDAVQGDAEYNDFVHRLRNFGGIKEVAISKAFKGTLRPYQLAGFNWLVFLQEYRFGGCLADDMGLGKTIQTLALLLHEQEKGQGKTSLIVAPTSVVFNWVHEIEKFAPSLRVFQQTGQERPRDAEMLHEYDLVLTTYGTLRNDVQFLKDFVFDYVILDESQNIKNPTSQTAKAVRLLKGDHRLVLTGTPIQNNTIELWSQMAFLNPGMLGSQKYFQTTFANAIEKHADEYMATLLQKLIYPFILRRTKGQVEQDLPPKTESLVYASMLPLQEKLYNTWRDFYRAAILKAIDAKGLNRSHIVVLEGLMKLRQIACHPMLVEKEAGTSSGKYEALLEQLEEILSEGHKVLIFSQFVKMLGILRRYLDSAHIAYEYLDGQTRDREARVQNFQQNADIKLFLISLRAGGTGLNLTAADYVIHFDPWWNPAVEAQASDRSHRIGQEKHVFVYKFITRGTVEEKVLELQERKKQLAEKLISTDRAFFKQLTRNDIESLFS